MIKNKMLKFGMTFIPNRLNQFGFLHKILFRSFLTLNRISIQKSLRILPNLNINFEMPMEKSENNLFQLQKKEMRSAQSKRKLKFPDPTYKIKTKNAARKRFRIIGKLFEKHFRHWPNNKRHKMLNKTRNNLKRKKSERYVHKTNMRHLKRLFPYFKRKKYRN